MAVFRPADIALRRLEAHRHPFPFRHLKYPEAGHTIVVPYWPLPNWRVITLPRVEGLQDHLLFQGGTAEADAEAGIDAWRDLLGVSRRREEDAPVMKCARRTVTPRGENLEFCTSQTLCERR